MKKKNKETKKVVYYLYPKHTFVDYGVNMTINDSMFVAFKSYFVAKFDDPQKRDPKIIIEELNGHQITLPAWAVLEEKGYKKVLDDINDRNLQKFIDRSIKTTEKVNKLIEALKTI